MSISGVRAISIFDNDAASPTFGTVVQKNRIASVGQFYTNGLVDGEDTAGQEVYAGDESLLEFECYDTQGNDQLEAWEGADKEVLLVLAGLQANVLWYEPATIKVTKPKGFGTGARNRTKIRIFKKGGVHKIWSGVNLLDGAVKVQGFATGWQDSNADGKADGYTLGTSAYALNFTSPIQSFTTANALSGLYIKLIFPISQKTYSLSSELLTSFSDVARLMIECLDASGSVILTAPTDVSLGRSKLNATSPSLTYSMNIWAMLRRESGSNGVVTFKNPALRTDDSNVYIAG